MDYSNRAVFILTHKRPTQQVTLDALKKSNYTGKVYLLVDDEDPTLAQYKELYGDMVVVFSKSRGRALTDDADNSPNAQSVIYARQMCWHVAKDLGIDYFVQLDDDYSGFYYRFDQDLQYYNKMLRVRNFDKLLDALIIWLETSNAMTVAISQGGDHMGGAFSKNAEHVHAYRKVMNFFVCATSRPFPFFGKLNDDTSAYLVAAMRGQLTMTTTQVQLTQKQTQTTAGGLTEIYKEAGTYAKTFFSVIFAPSCVKVSVLKAPNGTMPRIHHRIRWENAAVKVIPQKFKK